VVLLSTRRRLFKTFSLSLFVRVSFDVALARPRNRSIDCVVFKREREVKIVSIRRREFFQFNPHKNTRT
jgi:hypothetical protein